VDGWAGLSENEARRRLAQFGANELPRAEDRSFTRIALGTLREPMFMLLGGAAVLYLGLGDLAEGLFLLAGALLAMLLVVVQEARSERALRALRDLSAPHARVIRAGAERTIAARELVPGDIYLVSEGERLHADGLLVGGDALMVDEAALTGESAPVTKRLAPLGEQHATIDSENLQAAGVYAGTLIVRGHGAVEVSRTGASSAVGKIGASLARLREEPTPLQVTARRLVTGLGVMAVTFCGLIVLAYGLLQQDWIGGMLAGVTAAMSLVPEEFPMVLTVFMALGAWRLANHKVLVRRSAVIEALGGATVLCVDKTGTLTQNKMELMRVWRDKDQALSASQLGAPARDLLAAARLACTPRSIDPMDLAIERHCDALAIGARGDDPEQTWPLRPERLAVVQLWRSPDGTAMVAAKGAPEAIVSLCGGAEEHTERVRRQLQAYAEAGLRVLAVARGQVPGASPDEPEEISFSFLGLLAFEDPLRPEAPAAIAEARRAGVKVMMITGDHPATALAVAGALGLDTRCGCLLGAEAASLPLPTLRERLRVVCVLARVAPEQKLLVVEALKESGEVVAMTGDGVNDAPALEAAHIGIAIGRRGTDVAREAADLVLLDDSFASIVGGVRLGRRIFSNLRRALTFIVAVHVPIAGLALAPVLLGMPQLLWPMHVMLLELAIDPTCALVFENEPSERGAMRSPPRNPREGLFAARQTIWAVVQGALVLATILGLYAWFLTRASEDEARAIAYLTLIVSVLALALTDSMSPGARLFSRHRWPFALIAGGAGAILFAVLNLSPLERLFDFRTPEPPHLIAALLTGGVAGSCLGLARRLAIGTRTRLAAETTAAVE